MLSSEDIKKSLECCYAFDVMFCDKCPNKGTRERNTEEK